MNLKKISFLGNFGTQNLGNECTLQAVLHNVVKYSPETVVNCICPDPEDVRSRYNIPSFLITDRGANGVKFGLWGEGKNPLLRLFRRVIIGVPMELIRWVRAFKTLTGSNMLVMPGTGMLGDFGIGPFDLHYEILKWSFLAKLRRCKVLFVSVGAGPLCLPLSRWFVKCALSLADYCSFRDEFSRRYMESIGFRGYNHQVYPDLAFSLPLSAMKTVRKPEGEGRVIGVGLMEYYGKDCSRAHGEKIYQDYIGKLATFVTWLIDHKYIVRLLIGDVLYDKRVKEDMGILLERRGIKYEKGDIIDEPVSSVEELLSQLVTTDIVVASRFHNILLALMLNKPVVSISYHEKIDSLMAEMGLTEYSQQIDHLIADKLIDQFVKLVKNAENIKPYIEEKSGVYRRALEEQYGFIFNEI